MKGKALDSLCAFLLVKGQKQEVRKRKLKGTAWETQP